MNIKTTTVTLTAVLAALVVVFDYAMKFSGFKIPFPWLPVLKFDFTGVPIVLSLLILGLVPGAFASSVAFLAIAVRSPDLIGASMKALAEFSTILGMFAGLVWLEKKPRFAKLASFALGCLARVAVMALANLAVLPIQGMPFNAVIAISPLVAVFNLFHALISIFGGYLLYEALRRRVPSLILEEEANRNP